MNIEQYWQETKIDIDLAIKREVSHPHFTKDIPRRYLPAIEQSIEGGKRLRGMMVCLVCDALGGNRNKAILRAVAIECIHAATLVHDDIIDNDATRRGGPAIWTLEGVGREGAILIGDLLWAYGMKMICAFGSREAEAASYAMVKVTCGVLQEMSLACSVMKGNKVSMKFFPQHYCNLNALKTGELFGLSARLGALAIQEGYFGDVAYRYGRLCGEAFQIADDIVDTTKQSQECIELGELKKHQDILLDRMKISCAQAREVIRNFSRNEYQNMLEELPIFITEEMLKKVSA